MQQDDEIMLSTDLLVLCDLYHIVVIYLALSYIYI